MVHWLKRKWHSPAAIAALSLIVSLLVIGSALISDRTIYVWGLAPRINVSLIKIAEWLVLIPGTFLAFAIRKQGQQNSGKSYSAEVGKPSRPTPLAWSISLVSGYAILSLFVAYLALYCRSAYDSFYLQEHDFLNIAAALPGGDWLRTPYVNTGPTGSFLGHHFSPFLLLLKPFFQAIAWLPQANFTTYMLPLFLGAAWGVILWFETIRRYLDERYHWLLPVLATFLVCNPLVFRLSLSFHFEVFILPLSAGCILFWNRGHYWVFFLLLLSVKEDIAFYVFLVCASITLVHIWRHRPGSLTEAIHVILKQQPNGGPEHKPPNLAASWNSRRLLLSGTFALTYLLFAVAFQKLLAGDTGADWSHYWLQPFEWKGTQTTGLLIVILAGGWTALKHPALRIPLILICLMHILSRHPWHNSFQSHYVYTVTLIVLPSLFFLRHRAMALIIPLMLFAGMLDRSTPQPLLKESAYDSIVVLTRIPENSCVRASKHIAVRIPLHSSPFPIYEIAGNPEAERDLCQPPPGKDCGGLYLLLESQDTALLHGCQMQNLRFRAGTEHLNLFEYVQPGH